MRKMVVAMFVKIFQWTYEILLVISLDRPKVLWVFASIVAHQNYKSSC